MMKRRHGAGYSAKRIRGKGGFKTRNEDLEMGYDLVDILGWMV